MHMHTYPCICMPRHAYAWICTHMHGYACVCMHIHAYLYISMHMYAYACLCMPIHLQADVSVANNAKQTCPWFIGGTPTTARLQIVFPLLSSLYGSFTSMSLGQVNTIFNPQQKKNPLGLYDVPPAVVALSETSLKVRLQMRISMHTVSKAWCLSAIVGSKVVEFLCDRKAVLVGRREGAIIVMSRRLDAILGSVTMHNAELRLLDFAMAPLPADFSRSAESYMLCQNIDCVFSTSTIGGRAHTESPLCFLCDPKTLLVYARQPKRMYAEVYTSICARVPFYTDNYIYIRLLFSSWLLFLYRLTPVPPIPMARGQDFSFEGARTIHVYVYTYTSIRRSSPGKLCVGSVLAMCVLDQPWETMSWITPGKLCVASVLGNCVLSALVLSFWVPRFGSRFGADRAHGPLGQYVLHHVWHTMCCISAWKLCVACPFIE